MGCVCPKEAKETTNDTSSGLLGEESSEAEDIIDFSSKNAKQVLIASEKGSVSKKMNVEDFIFLKVLGRGAFGKVVLVKKKDSGNQYAMKIIRKDSLTRKNQKLRTKAERDILEGVECPFVVQLHYAFQSATKLYLIMDYMQGGELYFHYRKERKFKEPRVKFYIAEIVLGLEHLHGKGIIYRDLKLENILMDGDGHLKIADFGLSKQGIEGGKKTYSFCGTPDYLAPEILQSVGHDAAADYWSLGVMMYEMLAGYLPFRGNSTKDLFKNILEQPVDLKNKFSPEASSLIAAFLVTDPKKRLRDPADIKSHEFFKDIDWEKLAARKLPAPFKPESANDKKLNIDKKYQDEEINETFVNKVMATGNNTFKGFTYVPQRLSMQIDARPSISGHH